MIAEHQLARMGFQIELIAYVLNVVRRDEEAQGWFAKALEVADFVVDRHPTYTRAWANRAYLLWKTGDLDGAFESAIKAREIRAGYDFDADFLKYLKKNGKELPVPADDGEEADAGDGEPRETSRAPQDR